jgi:hypothetical protein
MVTILSVVTGGGARAAYGVPDALPAGGGGIAAVEMFVGPDSVLHAIGCSPAASSSSSASSSSPAWSSSSSSSSLSRCHHYVGGGKDAIGATPGVQWLGPIGIPSSPAQPAAEASASYPTVLWLPGAAPIIKGDPAGGYPGAAKTSEVPSHFLHASGGVISQFGVTWVPIPGYEAAGAYEPRHIHLAVAEQTATTAAAAAAAAAGQSNTSTVSVTVMWATWNASAATAAQLTPGNASLSTATATSRAKQAAAATPKLITGTSYSFAMDAPDSHHKSASLLQWEHVCLFSQLTPGQLYSYRPGSGASGTDFGGTGGSGPLQPWRQFIAPHVAGVQCSLPASPLSSRGL